MAKVKYGALIIEMKGKIGGQVFQQSRGGSIVKNMGAPISSNKAELLDVMDTGAGGAPVNARLGFAIITKSWSKLTDVQRASWSTLLGIYTFKNAYGETYNGTPFQIFSSINVIGRLAGISLLTSAPIAASAIDTEGEFGYPEDGTGVIIPAYKIGVDFDWRCVNTDAYGQKIVFACSQMLQPSDSIYKSKFKILDVDPTCSSDLKKLADVVKGRFLQDPIVGKIFYIQTWTSLSSYPKKQFLQTYKFEIVAGSD